MLGGTKLIWFPKMFHFAGQCGCKDFVNTVLLQIQTHKGEQRK